MFRSYVVGGNLNIGPEKALTWTSGFVYQPEFVDGLSLSVDYYQIDTKGLIAQLGTLNIINACANGDAGECANVTRAPDDGAGFGVGPLTFVNNPFQNIGESKSGPLTLFVQKRIIGEGNHSNRLNNSNVTEGVQINDNTVKAAYYTDLNATCAIEQYTGDELEVFTNVTNVFDRDPPIRGAFADFFGSQQAVFALHDVLVRRYTAGVRLRFLALVA